MRTAHSSKAYAIRLILAFCGIQLALLALAPQSALALLLSTLAAGGIGIAGYRRLDRPAADPRALGESEERFASLVASLREGILLRGRDATIFECNSGAEAIFGLPRERIVGSDSVLAGLEYVAPDGTPLSADQLPGYRALATGQPVDDVEFGIVRPDGGTKWIVASARPLFHGGESIAHAAVVSLNDVTERRAAEREVERQRTFLRTVLDAMPLLIAVRDREQRYVMVNRTLAGFYDATPRQMIGRSHGEFAKDPGRIEFTVRSELELLATGGISDPYEAEIKDAAGKQHWLQVSKRVISDRDGKPNLVLIVGTDVTERKGLQDELRRAVEVRDTILENSIVGIALLDAKGRAVVVNRATEEMFGVDRGAILGTSIEPFYPSRADYLATGAAVSRAVLEGRTYDAEQRMRRSDGTLFWVHLSGKAVGLGELRQGTVWVTVDITERKRIEEALRARERELQLIMNAVPAMITRLDRFERYLYVNRQYAELMERPAAEIIGKTLREVVDAGTYAIARPNIDTVLAGKTVQFERSQRLSDGNTRVLAVNYLPDMNQSGEVCGWFGMHHDVTDERLALERLARSEARFRSLTELSADWYWEQDENLRFVESSIGALERSGMTRDERIGKTRWEVPSVGVTEAQWAAHRADLEARRPFRDFEIARIDRDGNTVYISSSGVPIFDADGVFKGYRGIGRNITARKRAEAQLRESEERFRSLTELSSDWYWEQDEELRLSFHSSGFERSSGTTSDKLLGKRRWEEPNRFPLNATWEQHRATLEARKPFRDFEYVRIGNDGKRHFASLSGVPIFDPAGNFRGYRGIGQNITEHKQAEALLQRMNEELERRVAERTSQLEASVKELEAYSYTISHDLRAPLRAIDGFSQILIEEARGSLAPEARGCLDRISQNARRMAELIDALLAFARYSRAPLECREIDLAALVQAVVDEQPREGREIEFRIDPLLHCVADAQLLRQVFGNLVSNAVKYSRTRSAARVEIGSFEREAATVYYVRDNGVGFDMAYVHKLFRVFHRLHSEREFEGVGAGLAIVQRIVARHGGRIWAEGDLGKGATFYFTLGGGQAVPAAA